MSQRESIALQAQEVLDEGTDPWGIKVERVCLSWKSFKFCIFQIEKFFHILYPFKNKKQRTTIQIQVEVKDIKLPQMLTRAMAREAEASRAADASVVSSRGELNVRIY